MTGIQPGNVFTIAPGCNFLDVLVENLFAGNLITGYKPELGSLSLSQATIYVPNRRTGRELANAFLRYCDGGAMLLPNIRQLGDTGDEAFGTGEQWDSIAQLPSAIPSLQRKLDLARMVDTWTSAMEAETRALYDDETIVIPSTKADALRLAEQLCLLLDKITLEETNWNSIQDIVPDTYAEWWKLTSTFLAIVMKRWPEYLSQIGLVDPSWRNAQLLELRRTALETQPPTGPVIAAGSTGSVPSTRRFLKTVSSLPNGAVILPGLDHMMSREEWQNLAEGDPAREPTLEAHPQYGLAQLSRALGIQRENIIELGSCHNALRERERVVSIALSRSQTSAQWVQHAQSFEPALIDDALEGITIIDAPNERREAMAIAVAMREVLTSDHKTAALVTPDRNLARRVAVELRRFGIDIDDTGGTPLRNTALAQFARQLAELVFGEADTVCITSFLKNRFCLAGQESVAASRMARLFELITLRGTIHPPVPGKFHDYLQRRRAEITEDRHAPAEAKRLDDDGWEALLQHTSLIDHALGNLIAIAEQAEEVTLSEIMATCTDALRMLTNGHGEASGIEGSEEFVSLLMETERDGKEYLLEPAEFPQVLDCLIAPVTVRPRFPKHPRLHIYGPLEARLIDFDRVILAGLNEGTWPQITRSDPFLNRSMQSEVGMASPERQTGLSAHDFQQLMGKPDVILSRSARSDGAPSVMSRWLQRLMALLGETCSDALVTKGARYVRLGEVLDTSGKANPPSKRPCEFPPVDVRPTSLYVTDIELWIRDPYALYAKHILKLRPLPELQRTSDAALKGTLYHDVLEAYVTERNYDKPIAARLERLDTLIRERVGAEKLPKEIEQVWLIRFLEIAEDFVNWEEKHHGAGTIGAIHCEVDGKHALPDADFILRARADRIDELSDGSLHVLDYKTGSSPSIGQARTLSPQLALEGIIAREGGFENVSAGPLSELSLMRLRRGKEFGDKGLSDKKMSAGDYAEKALKELTAMVIAFSSEDQGYISRRVPFKDSELAGDYDHLARSREWSLDDESEASQ